MICQSRLVYLKIYLVILMNVYDFDRTIYRKDSEVDFFFYLLKKQPSLLRFIPKQCLGFIKYFLRIIDKTSMKSNFYCYLKGVKNIDQEIDEFWDKHIDNIHSWYKERHQDSDVVITASPEFLVKVACDRLNVARCLGTPVSIKESKIIGLNCHDKEKVRRFVEAGYDVNDVEEFYSDSYSDQPLRDIAKKGYLVKGEELIDWK